MTSRDTELAILQNEVKNIKEQNSCEHKEIKDTVAELKSDIKDFIESADRKFAPAWVKDLMWVMIIAIIMAFIGAITYTIGWK